MKIKWTGAETAVRAVQNGEKIAVKKGSIIDVDASFEVRLRAYRSQFEIAADAPVEKRETAAVKTEAVKKSSAKPKK